MTSILGLRTLGEWVEQGERDLCMYFQVGGEA